MKILKKAAAVLVSLAVACSTALPAFAQTPAASAGVSKNEDVFLILNDDGTVKRQIVSDWLHSDAGIKNLEDKSSLADIQNLKSDAQPQKNGDSLVWNDDGNDLYYQGSTDQTPPVTVSISYKLDGRQMTAGELAGKSGHLVMSIALTNHESAKQTIAGVQRTVYTPFFTVVAASLPVGSFTNIAAEHGTVQTDANNQLVCFLAMPGMAETFSGLLTGELAPFRDYLLDTVTVEADVTNFTTPGVMLAASTNMEDLSADVNVPDFSGEMSELTDATNQLKDGASTLADATATLQSKMDEFAAQYATFDAGVDSALTGAQQVKAGTDSLLTGATQLQTGSGDLSAGAGQLQAGSAALAGKLNSQLVPGLSDAAAKKATLEAQMTKVSGELNNVSLPDVAALKTQLGTGVGQVFDGALATGAQTAAANVGSGVKTGCKTAADAALTAAAPQVAQSVAAGAGNAASQAVTAALANSGLTAEQIAAVANAASQAAAQAGAADIATPLKNAVNGAIDGNVTVDAAAVAAQIAASQQAQTARAGAVTQVTGALNGLDTTSLQAMLGEFKTISASAGGMMQSIDTLTSALYNAADPADQNTVVGASNALAAGASSVQAGADKLYGGTTQLASGVAELRNGADSLQAGLTQLSSASKTVQSAIGQFQTGAASLADGGRQLSDGVNTFSTQAIDRITSMVDTDTMSALSETLKAVRTRAENYTSYTGAAKGTSCSIKFVMKTESTSLTPTASSTTVLESEPTNVTESNSTFWTRVKNLF